MYALTQAVSLAAADAPPNPAGVICVLIIVGIVVAALHSVFKPRGYRINHRGTTIVEPK
jgi:hypothetical protein